MEQFLSVLKILKEHYEKLLLGILVVGFGIALYWLSGAIRSTREVGIAELKFAKTAADYPAADFTTPDFDLPKILGEATVWRNREGMKRKDLAFAAELVAPIKAIRCSSPDCKKILPLEAIKAMSDADRKCPICDTKLEDPPDVSQSALDAGGVDSDNDGMPDAYELKMGLNPKDPSDASKDADNDGFSNLYEFLMGTDPLNPKSFPGLDKRIYLVRLRRVSLPYKLLKVIPEGTDKKLWTLQVEDRPNRQQLFWTVGQEVKIKDKTYKITDAIHQERGVAETTVVVSQDDSQIILEPVGGGEKIVMQSGKLAYSPDQKAVIEDIGIQKLFSVGVGETLRVGDATSGATFQVLKIDPVKEHVTLLNQENGAEVLLTRDIKIPPQARVQKDGGYERGGAGFDGGGLTGAGRMDLPPQQRRGRGRN